jgi:hypothetical protein
VPLQGNTPAASLTSSQAVIRRHGAKERWRCGAAVGRVAQLRLATQPRVVQRCLGLGHHGCRRLRRINKWTSLNLAAAV